MTYTPNPVHFNGSYYVGRPPAEIFPGTLTTFVISVWTYGGAINQALDILDEDPNIGLGNAIRLAIQADNLTLGATSSGSNLLSADPLFTLTSCTNNFLISVDLLTQQYQLYINDSPISITPDHSAGGGIGFAALTTVASWGTSGAAIDAMIGYQSDFWFGSTVGFVDLSVSSNRRKFINADLTPVDLGATGQNPFGTAPNIFQNIIGADPASAWTTNRGTAGGAFSDDTVNGIFVPSVGTLSLDGNPCGGPPSPPDPLLCADPHSQSEITPEWSAVDGATSYALQYRIADSGSPFTEIDDILTTQYTITSLLPGTQYEWQVSAQTPDGDTGFGTSGFCFTDPSPFMFLACENGWTVTAPVQQIWGFDHLIGMTVVGLADGVQLAPQTVAADGSITLPFPASNVKIGLPFTSQLQLPYLDAGTPTVQGRRKVVTAVTVRVDASNGVQLGTNQTDGSTLKPQAIAPLWPNMQNVPIQAQPSSDPQPLTYTSPSGQTVNFLQTGDLRTVVTAQWLKPGQVAIQQTNPLPLTVLSAMPELLEGDVTEQGYAQEQKPQQHPDHRRQHQGPGAWMLRK